MKVSLTRRKDPVTYIPMSKALETYHLAADQVQQAIDTGQIETAQLVDSDVPLLLEESLRDWLAKQRVDRSQFASLEGCPISITDAEQKYGFPYITIQRWIKKGKVRQLGTDPKHERRHLINEADIAYAHALAKLKQPIAGQSIFN